MKSDRKRPKIVRVYDADGNPTEFVGCVTMIERVRGVGIVVTVSGQQRRVTVPLKQVKITRAPRFTQVNVHRGSDLTLGALDIDEVKP